ncbi:MAG: LamG-like jellyroll fold domain-containing protein [Candidatus Brocadiia bacterium]
MTMDRTPTEAAGSREEPGKWSWQQAHARVMPTGDLEWAPRPFVFEAGGSVRYIDYEGGSDDNPGTKEAPWQHHPWDPEARGRAAECSGVHTYFFKRGVAYRGRLIADDSGGPNEPIRLTSDPDWGDGEACFYGSEKLEGGWQRCTRETAPSGLPQPEKVWWKDIGTDFTPRCLWEVRDGEITRLPIARSPHWEITEPDDIKSEWCEWKQIGTEEEDTDGETRLVVLGTDPEHLTAEDPDAYAGATLWTEYEGVMGTPYACEVEGYDPESHTIRFGTAYLDNHYKPCPHCRYFLENLPRFLDAPGEYYYAADGPHAGRLFVRLPGDRDPNTTTLEAARYLTLVDVRSQSHVEVTGLTFRFENVWNWFDRPSVHVDVEPACVRFLGTCRGVRVANCTFEHVARAVCAYAQGGPDVIDDLVVTDNDIAWTDHGGLKLTDGWVWGHGPAPIGDLERVTVLRNRLREIGHRAVRSPHAHALEVRYGQLIEVAGNVLDRCYGAGVFIFGGKGGDRRNKPLIRVLVHHNKVTSPLLNTNDWGGVETWQGGPTYVFCNVSGNPGGYWHWKHLAYGTDPAERDHCTARFGFAYYLDGAFKNYVFNNIGWGVDNDLTSPHCHTAGVQEVIGFLNAFFHNTFYRFAVGSRRQGPQGGRNYYLGNLLIDASEYWLYHAQAKVAPDAPNAADVARAGKLTNPYDYETLAYRDNVFCGSPRHFGVFEHTGLVHETLPDYREALSSREPLADQVGVEAEESPVRDAEAHDFRPAPSSAAEGRGARFFVPWGLKAVVGEWHFYHLPDDPARVLGENFYMTDEYVNRGMYRYIPRNDLTAHGVGSEDYVEGPLEDWTRGALSFNGRDQHCVLTDADMKSDYTYRLGGEEHTYPGEKRRTLDMDTSNFLIEAFLRTVPGHAGGVIASKVGDAGYLLRVDEAGRPELEIRTAESGTYRRAADSPVNDGQWHHVVAEADRDGGIALYVDGKRSDGPSSGQMPDTDASLANSADFFVGRGPDGDHFAGAIDFLRVSRGTLADARTSIEELHAWEFDGPFRRDFAGNETADKRAAGALDAPAEDT